MAQIIIRTKNGFTLLELLLVLTIFSITIALVVPVINAGIGRTETVTAAKRIGAALNHAKQLAVRERLNHSVEVRDSSVLIKSSDGRIKKEMMLSKSVDILSPANVTVFSPRGGSNSGEYIIKDDGSEFVVRVASSGQIKIESNKN